MSTGSSKTGLSECQTFLNRHFSDVFDPLLHEYRLIFNDGIAAFRISCPSPMVVQFPFRKQSPVDGAWSRPSVNRRPGVHLLASQFAFSTDRELRVRAGLIEKPDPKWDSKFQSIEACAECKGPGHVLCNFNHEHPCGKCTNGFAVTDHSAGKTVDAGGVPYDWRRMYYITRLPRIEFFRHPSTRNLHFVFKFGCGVIAPSN